MCWISNEGHSPFPQMRVMGQVSKGQTNSGFHLLNSFKFSDKDAAAFKLIINMFYWLNRNCTSNKILNKITSFSDNLKSCLQNVFHWNESNLNSFFMQVSFTDLLSFVWPWVVTTVPTAKKCSNFANESDQFCLYSSRNCCL